MDALTAEDAHLIGHHQVAMKAWMKEARVLIGKGTDREDVKPMTMTPIEVANVTRKLSKAAYRVFEEASSKKGFKMPKIEDMKLMRQRAHKEGNRKRKDNAKEASARARSEGYTFLKKKDRAEILVEIVLGEDMNQATARSFLKCFDYLWPFQLRANEDHCGVRLSDLMCGIAAEKDSIWRMVERSMKDDKNNECIEGSQKPMKFGSLGEYVTQVLTSCMSGSNNYACRGAFLNEHMSRFFRWLAANGLLRLFDEAWRKAFKPLSGVIKKLRCTPVLMERVISAQEYGELSYPHMLASRGGWPIDIDEEVEKRQNVKAETLAFDPVTRKFTAARAVKMRERAIKKMYGTDKRDEDLPTAYKYVEDAFEKWRSRQIWSAAGAAGGWTAHVTEENGEFKPLIAAREAGRRWIEKAWKKYEAGVGTDEAAGISRDIEPEARKEKFMTASAVSLNKRGALERMLWESAWKRWRK